MIDNFALAVSHGLLAILTWRLLSRVDLDYDLEPEEGEETSQPATEPKKESFARRA